MPTIHHSRRPAPLPSSWDLGVIISEDLKWEKQCSSAVSKANSILGMIKRNFVDRSKETIMLLYKSLVRPHLEYCCRVWSDHYSKDIIIIIIIITMTMFTVLSSWHSHCESSPGSFDECRLSGQTKPTDLGCESADLLSSVHHRHFIITQLVRA